MFKDRFIKDNLIMFIGISFSSALALIYQLYVIRRLTPQEFGLFNSLLAILSIVSIALGAFQTITADFVARLFAGKQLIAIRHFLYKILKKILIISLVFLFCFFLFLRYIAVFLQTDSYYSVVVVGLAIILYFALSVFHGALQGLQKFRSLSNNLIIQSISRLVIGIFLIVVGFKVMGALLAFAVSTLIALIAVVFTMRAFWDSRKFRITAVSPAQPENISNRKIIKYFIPAALGLFSFMLLTNVDMVLVKHFFSPTDSGYYSIAQMVGRIVLFFSTPVALVMFPKTTNNHSLSLETRHILNKSLLIVAILCIFIISIVFLFPDFTLLIITGKSLLESLSLVKLFSIAMGFYALSSVFLFYNLSVRNFAAVFILVLFALAQIILIGIFHSSLIDVVRVLCSVSVALFIVNILLLNKKWKIPLLA